MVGAATAGVLAAAGAAIGGIGRGIGRGIGSAARWAGRTARGWFGQGSSLAKNGGIPPTGVAALDELAINSRSFAQKLAYIRKSGFNPDPTEALVARAEFSPGVFRYNPKTLTRLDLAHEMRHLRQIRQVMAKGIKLDSQAFRAMEGPGEIGAYRYEARLWSRAGLTPSSEYLTFHAEKMGSYDAQCASFRSFVRQDYGRKWASIEW